MFKRSSARRRPASTEFSLAKALVVSTALFATFGVENADFGSAFGPAKVQAQNIINNSRGSSNRFTSFSSRAIEKAARQDAYATGSFLDAKRESLDFPSPTSAPKQIDELTYRIPFVFPKGSDPNGASGVELYCSDDQGATWFSYASIEAEDGRNAFLFEAPEPGEYWFVLKTYFRNNKVAYSTTRAYTFGDPDRLAPEPIEEVSYDAPVFADDDAPQLLPIADDLGDSLFIDETSAQSNEPDGTSAESFALNDDSASQADAPSADGSVASRPGRLKQLSFSKEEETDRLMVIVRWFTPDELEEQYRGTYTKLNVEQAASPDGPWQVVGKDLSISQPGYGWIATAENMKPFYVRTNVVDENGKSLFDVTTSPLDVMTPGLKDALGFVKTPVPFPSEKKKVEEKSNAKKSESDKGVARIRTTSSSSEDEDAESEDAPEVAADAAKSEDEVKDVDKARDELKAATPKSNEKKLETTQRTTAPYKPRPIVPAPTNPNEMEVNPLFTHGFGVLYRAAQTRHASDRGDSKRSIFTPPSQVERSAAIPPARQRRTQAQIAAAQAKANREKMEEQAKYAREHEMEELEKKPELMQGRVFYMDSNGNMTTTPPAEFLQAQNNWQVTNVGDPIAVGQDGQPLDGSTLPADSGAFPGAVSGYPQNGDQGLYMPTNTDDYDASARSGAAIMSNDYFMQNAASGSSPLNQRYNGSAQPVPNMSQPVMVPSNSGAVMQNVPQTSYSQNYTPATIPYNYNAVPSYDASPAATGPSAFPPRPTVR